MIKISINANRSDIAGYISYYSSKEIAPLLEIDEKEIIYEAPVVDYFAFGDVDFNTRVEATVTIGNEYVSHMDEISDILAKYLSGFVSEFYIRYEIIDTSLIYAYKVEGKPCHCHDDGCDCEDGACHCHDDGCDCEGDACHCHDEGCTCKEHAHTCGCKEGEECTCGDSCECGDDCTCKDKKKTNSKKKTSSKKKTK